LCPLSDKHAFVEHRKLDTRKDIQGKDIVAGQDEGKKKKIKSQYKCGVVS